MKQIGSLFAKYQKNLRPPQATVEREAVRIIKQVTGISLKDEQLSYSTGSRTLKINAPAVLRTEVVRMKGEVLGELKRSLGASSTPTSIL